MYLLRPRHKATTSSVLCAYAIVFLLECQQNLLRMIAIGPLDIYDDILFDGMECLMDVAALVVAITAQSLYWNRGKKS